MNSNKFLRKEAMNITPTYKAARTLGEMFKGASPRVQRLMRRIGYTMGEPRYNAAKYSIETRPLFSKSQFLKGVRRAINEKGGAQQAILDSMAHARHSDASHIPPSINRGVLIEPVRKLLAGKTKKDITNALRVLSERQGNNLLGLNYKHWNWQGLTEGLAQPEAYLDVTPRRFGSLVSDALSKKYY